MALWAHVKIRAGASLESAAEGAYQLWIAASPSAFEEERHVHAL